MDLNGTIIKIEETKTIGLKGFQKRLLVIKTNEQYPQTLPIEFMQDKINLLDEFAVNDNVTVGVNLRGSEWKGNFYVNLIGWKIKKDGMPKGLTAEKQMPNRPEVSTDLPF